MKRKDSSVYVHLEAIPHQGEWKLTIDHTNQREKISIVDMSIVVDRLFQRLDALDAEEAKGEPRPRHVVRFGEAADTVTLSLTPLEFRKLANYIIRRYEAGIGVRLEARVFKKRS
jgi:hypothetical protein